MAGTGPGDDLDQRRHRSSRRAAGSSAGGALELPWFVEPTRSSTSMRFAKFDRRAAQRARTRVVVARAPALPLAKLTDVPDLTALVLDDTRDRRRRMLAEAHLALKRSISSARELAIRASKALVTREPQLEVLDLEGCAVGDPAVAAIAALANSTRSNLAGTRISGYRRRRARRTAPARDPRSRQDRRSRRDGRRDPSARAARAVHPADLVGKEIATLGGYAPGTRAVRASSLASEYKPSDADVAWLANRAEPRRGRAVGIESRRQDRDSDRGAARISTSSGSLRRRSRMRRSRRSRTRTELPRAESRRHAGR